MTSYSIWLDLQAEVNTSPNGWVRPESDFIKELNKISIKLWNKYTGMAEKSQEVKDKLLPFLKSKNLIVQQTGYEGIATKPKDYGRYASARIVVHKEDTIPDKNVDSGKCEGFKTPEEQEAITQEYYDNIIQRQVELIDNQRWGAFLSHLTKGPTFEKPGMTQIDGNFKVAPRKVSVIVLDYYIEPIPATFDYTLSAGSVQTGSGEQVIYNATTSTPLQWGEQMREEFVQELKGWYVQAMRDSMLSNISAQQKQMNP